VPIKAHYCFIGHAKRLRLVPLCVFFSLLSVLIRRKPVGRQPLTLLLYEGTVIEGLIAPGALTAQQLLLLAISNI
jgi:hypothetical protein